MSNKTFRQHRRVGRVSIVDDGHGKPSVLIHLPDGRRVKPGAERLPNYWRYLDHMARQATAKLPHLH